MVWALSFSPILYGPSHLFYREKGWDFLFCPRAQRLVPPVPSRLARCRSEQAPRGGPERLSRRAVSQRPVPPAFCNPELCKTISFRRGSSMLRKTSRPRFRASC